MQHPAHINREDNVKWQKMQHGTRAAEKSAYNNRALLQERQEYHASAHQPGGMRRLPGADTGVSKDVFNTEDRSAPETGLFPFPAHEGDPANLVDPTGRARQLAVHAAVDGPYPRRSRLPGRAQVLRPLRERGTGRRGVRSVDHRRRPRRAAPARAAHRAAPRR